MNSKIGMFSVLVLGVMMLLIPSSSSLASAQEYDNDKTYKDNEKYSYEYEPYKKEDNKKSDEPVIIIKNEPIVKKEKKEMKEPPMLLVKKDVLYCDAFSGISNNECFNPVPGPESDRYVQECTGDNPVCNNINAESFDIIVT
ncbi:MAG: hypothetical protein ACPKPY_01780, partial [Nitrososphaeraceae archaeon]